MKKISSISVIALSIVLFGAGCSVSKTYDTSGSVSTKTPSENVADGKDSKDASKKLWTSNVTNNAGIPSSAVAGKINNKPETIASVTVEERFGKYEWKFSNKAPSKTCGFLKDDNSVILSSSELTTGTFTKKLNEDVDFDDFSAFYVYEQENGVPFSVNEDWEATMIVTDYTENVSKTSSGKNVGSVKGYVQIAFKSGKTEIAGAFTGDVCE